MNTDPSTKNTLWEEKNSIEPKKNCLNNSVNDQKDIINDTNNVSTKNQCKDTGKISGVYKIVNKVDDKYYVGSSNDILTHGMGRWYHHKRDLNKNVHPNIHLQNAWNKYGESNFEFIIIQRCEIDQLLILEQKQLDIAKLDRNNVYNMTFTAGRIDMTNEIKFKISQSAKKRLQCKTNHPLYGKHHKESTKKLISDKNKLYFSNPKNNPMYGVHRFGQDNPNYGIRGKTAGHLNGRYNPTIYTFYNVISKETFTGTKFDFCKKHQIKKTVPNDLIRNHIKQSKSGWIKVD